MSETHEMTPAEFNRRDAKRTARETGPRYPQITVQLTGRDGNAFAILGTVSKALREAGIPTDEFMAEATSDDYSHLLATCMRWVDVA